MNLTRKTKDEKKPNQNRKVSGQARNQITETIANGSNSKDVARSEQNQVS